MIISNRIKRACEWEEGALACVGNSIGILDPGKPLENRTMIQQAGWTRSLVGVCVAASLCDQLQLMRDPFPVSLGALRPSAGACYESSWTKNSESRGIPMKSVCSQIGAQ